VQPDSAIALLEELKAENAQWDKATQMYYHLLTVKACDKAFITHTSDSLMHSVLQYYEHGGDKQLLPEAYYYMGSTYRDMNDAPRALEYYQKALEVMPEGASPLRRYVNNQIGWLFYRQKLYDEALSCYQRSYQNDSILEDKAEMASDLRNAGYIFRCKDNFEAALDTYYQAKEILADLNNTTVMDEVDSQIASLLLALGKNDEAKRFIMLPLKRVTRSSISNVFSIAAKAYLRVGQIDSAIYYYNELLKYGNIYGRQVAYEQLGLFALKDKRNDEALYYTNMFNVLTDSIQKITATESVAQMSSLYNYQKAIEEREAITHQNNTNRWIIFILSLSFIVIALCAIFIYKQMRNRREAMQYKIDEIKQNQQVAQIMAERSISDKNERIADLELQLQIVGDTNVMLTKQLEEQRAFIQQQIVDAQEKLEQKDDINTKLNDSKIHSRLIYLINNKNKLGKRDLEELYATFQTVAPTFMENLTSLCKMNDLEKEVTLLIRMGISPNDIASLTSYSKQHISGIRKGLYMKVKGVDAKPAKWDELISLL